MGAALAIDYWGGTGWPCTNPDGGSLTLTIRNTDDPNGIKSIFLQVTGSKGPNDVTVAGTGGAPGGYTSGSWTTGRPHIQHNGPAGNEESSFGRV